MNDHVLIVFGIAGLSFRLFASLFVYLVVYLSVRLTVFDIVGLFVRLCACCFVCFFVACSFIDLFVWCGFAGDVTLGLNKSCAIIKDNNFTFVLATTKS